MSNKPILYTLVAAGLFATVSAPLAFIVGVFVIYATGSITAGIIAGAITTVVFVSWASYATYNWTSQQERTNASAA
ncbi:hypothetical protein BRC87_06810 [Halobacteriales archaeon QS_4_66_20]|nr:MAG: hypothetical protein BRC87_06810 [Halobacteriales archaeon QS_4_66_20]